MATRAMAEAPGLRSNASDRGVLLRGLLVAGLLVTAAAGLSSCKQAGGFPGSSTPATDGAITASSAGGAQPASLLPGSGEPSLTRALAGNAGFVTLVDKQGVSWSVQVGQPYNAASGHLCKPLRMTSLARAGNFDRVACVDDRGIWQMIAPLRGTDSGPSF